MTGSLSNIIRQHALKRGEFTLKSGKKSDYYLDLRQVLFHSDRLKVVVHEVDWALTAYRIGCDCDAIGVVPFGATPLLGALLCRLHHMHGFVVRPEVKLHGTGGRIAGALNKGDRVVLIEDVVTTGGSVVSAIQDVVEAGARVMSVVAIVDRQEGGREAIEATDVKFHPLYTAAYLLEE